jgi:hypothetical protein
MILALADAQTFALVAVVDLQDSRTGGWANVVFEAALAVGFIIGFIGLYRIKVWGALLNAALAVVCLIAAATQMVKLLDLFRGLFIALSSLQIAAAIPLLVALTTKKTMPSLPPRFRLLGTNLAVVVLVVYSVVRFTRKM